MTKRCVEEVQIVPGTIGERVCEVFGVQNNGDLGRMSADIVDACAVLRKGHIHAVVEIPGKNRRSLTLCTEAPITLIAAFGV